VAELTEPFDRRRRRRGALPVDDEHLVAVGAVEQDWNFAARPVQVRLDDLQHEPGRHRCVESVPAALEHRHPGSRGEPVRRGDHAEGAAQLGPGRETLHRA
jgi:hypothetical protein